MLKGSASTRGDGGTAIVRPVNPGNRLRMPRFQRQRMFDRTLPIRLLANQAVG